MTAQNSGELDAAVEAYKRSAKRDPDCGICVYQVAYALLLQNRAVDALEMAQRARLMSPAQIEPVLLVAKAAFAAEQFDVAATYARAATQRSPQLVEGWQTLFIVVRRTGDDAVIDRALAAMDGLEDPGVVACLRGEVLADRDDKAGARALLEACRAGGGPAAAHSLAVAIGDETGSLDAMVETFEARGASVYLSLARSRVLERAGDLVGAASVLDAAVAQAPDSPLVLLGRASVRARLGEPNAALADLEVMLGEAPKIDMTATGHWVGTLTKSHADQAARSVARGAVLYVEILVNMGDVQRARAGLERLERTWHDRGAVDGAAAVLVALRGDPSAAWARLDAALQAGPNKLSLTPATAWMVEHHPAGRTRAALALLGSPGLAFEAYNAAVGLQNREDWAACVDVLRGGLEDGVLADRWMELRLVCAYELGDPAQIAEAEAAGPEIARESVRLRLRRAEMAEAAEQHEQVLLELDGLPDLDEAGATPLDVRRAVALMGLGRLDDARDLVEGATAPAWLRYNLTLVFFRAGRHADAVELGALVPRDDAELRMEAVNLMAIALMEQGDLAAARALVEGEPSLPVNRLNLGVAFLNQGDAEVALGLLEPACPELVTAVPEAVSLCQEALASARARATP